MSRNPTQREIDTACCDDFAKACMTGTDNEGYWSLLFMDEHGDWRIGYGYSLTRVRFCPWCGHRKFDVDPE